MAKGIYKELTLSIGKFVLLLYQTWKKSMYYGAINIYKYPISLLSNVVIRLMYDITNKYTIWFILRQKETAKCIHIKSGKMFLQILLNVTMTLNI